MSTTLVIKVYKDVCSLFGNKSCFGRRLIFDTNRPLVLPVDFGKIIDVMKMLYGNDCVVTFQYHEIQKM